MDTTIVGACTRLWMTSATEQGFRIINRLVLQVTQREAAEAYVAAKRKPDMLYQ